MFYYLIHIQYLGFRYHGWAKQPKIKTVHHMIDRSINYVFGGEKKFKTLGSSKTDAMVSANHAVFELFVHEELDKETFMKELNPNLPSDIRVLKIEETDATFNVIQHPKLKEYSYLFSFGEKPHPFCASLMSYFAFELDIELMKKAAPMFEGKHNFVKYCYKPSVGVDFEREVYKSELVENTVYTANFFPEQSFAFNVHGKGFMRHQIRLMMGQLISLGKGETTLEEFRSSIYNPTGSYFKFAAPASGLILHHIQFE